MSSAIFSVIITCYNEEKFIGETLDSVLNQSRINLIKEIIVTDDGSVDNSKEEILKKSEKNAIIKYVYQENKGLPSARNTCIQHSSGHYIAILDGDDLWEKNKIETVWEYVNKYPQVGLFYSNYYKYYHEKKQIPHKVNVYQHDEKKLLQKFLSKGGPIVPSSVVIKKECFDNLGLFDPKFMMAEDTDMWLRIAVKYPFQHIPQFLLKKREWENSLGANTVENARYYKMAFDKIETLAPELKPYRRQRDVIVHYKIGLYYYNKGEWKNARKQALQAILKKMSYFKAYALWISAVVKPSFKIDILKVFKKV